MPRAMKTAWSMTKQTFSEWSDDNGGRLGAALSYYTIFSIAPLLLLIISIAGLAFGRQAAEGRIFTELSGVLGGDAAELVQGAVAKASETKGGVIGTIIGIVVLLVGATGIVIELQGALNAVWKVKPKPNRGVWGVVRTRILSVAMILSLGFLLLVSLVVSAGLAAFSGWLRSVIGGRGHPGMVPGRGRRAGGHHDDGRADLQDGARRARRVARRLGGRGGDRGPLPGRQVPHRPVHRQGERGSAFGAAGSLAVLLVWIYYSAQIVFLGAEFTRVYANRFGAKVKPSAQAVAAEAAVERPPAPDALPQKA